MTLRYGSQSQSQNPTMLLAKAHGAQAAADAEGAHALRCLKVLSNPTHLRHEQRLRRIAGQFSQVQGRVCQAEVRITDESKIY